MARLGIWACILGTALLRINGAAIGLMLQTYEEDVGAMPSVVGLIAVSFYLTELMGAPLFGTWVDRHGWKRFMLLGPLLAAVAVLLTWASVLLRDTLLLLLAVLFFTRLLEGIAVASNTPATLSYITAATSHDAALRARISGYFELAAIGGTALGGSLGGRTYQAIGVAGFGVLAVLYLVGWAIFRLVPATLSGEQHQAVSHSNPLRLLRQGAIWSFAPAWVAVNGIIGLWLNNVAYQLTLSCAAPPRPEIAALCQRIGGQVLVGGYSDELAGDMITGFALLFAVGMIIWMRVLPRLRKTHAMQIALIGGILTCGVLAGINNLPHAPTGTLVLLGGALGATLMLLSGFTVAALMVLMQLADRYASDRGAMMGIYSVLLGVGQFIGGSLGGVVAQWQGVNGMIGLTLFFTLLSALFVTLFQHLEAV